ncbi:V-ATPase V1 sector subunit E [Brettanomyces bruxellensis]|nr:V-ATPase V1 sector subunit E [Brettanomyces bruxellensis]
MEAFITKEAEEKAKEIKLKADEEYEIEKASIVRSEKNAIDSQYEDKFKKASLAQQITKSTIANKTRLKILATRDQCLQDIFDSAEEQLKQLSKDPATYESLLVGLIDEGLLQLMEPAVTLRVRKADVSVTKKAADQAEKKFKDVSGRDVKITIDETKYLSDKSAGGLILANGTGKIEINNTLEERLRLLSERALPAVRLEMFGVSTTRKFFD